MKPVSATTISDSDEAMSDVKPKKIVNKKDEGNGKGKVSRQSRSREMGTDYLRRNRDRLK